MKWDDIQHYYTGEQCSQGSTAPPLMKIQLQRSLLLVSSSSQCRDCNMLAGVRIMNGNGLILVGEVSDDTFCQYVERLAK